MEIDNLLGQLPFEWYVENLLLSNLYSKLIQVQPKKAMKSFILWISTETFVKIGAEKGGRGVLQPIHWAFSELFRWPNDRIRWLRFYLVINFVIDSRLRKRQVQLTFELEWIFLLDNSTEVSDIFCTGCILSIVILYFPQAIFMNRTLSDFPRIMYCSL